MITINRSYEAYEHFILGKTVRLVDGYRDGEGRVEIFHHGHWGTVCDDSWDLNDAQVVCRQLGYLRAHLATHSSLFGEGNGQIWVDEVNCTGNESSLEDCPHDGWNNHDCEHSEDASVICLNETAEFGECCCLMSHCLRQHCNCLSNASTAYFLI